MWPLLFDRYFVFGPHSFRLRTVRGHPLGRIPPREALCVEVDAVEQHCELRGLHLRVEHDAKEQKNIGTKAHLRPRRQRAGPIRDQLHEWLLRQQPRHPPKSPISAAIRYALNQWRELGRFLDDARVPLDNNASERSLRRVALGRKNYLFVGDVEAGSSIAGLYTLVATCEARGINPFAYLADVIPRVQDHPKRRLDQLLPGPWARSRADA
jgi:transposase